MVIVVVGGSGDGGGSGVWESVRGWGKADSNGSHLGCSP